MIINHTEQPRLNFKVGELVTSLVDNLVGICRDNFGYDEKWCNILVHLNEPDENGRESGLKLVKIQN